MIIVLLRIELLLMLEFRVLNFCKVIEVCWE